MKKPDPLDETRLPQFLRDALQRGREYAEEHAPSVMMGRLSWDALMDMFEAHLDEFRAEQEKLIPPDKPAGLQNLDLAVHAIRRGFMDRASPMIEGWQPDQEGSA